MTEGLGSRPLKIVCPTYWYPQHSADIHATYVHDINRHLVARGHRVQVVTPGAKGLAPRDEFDGVEVIRFPFDLPEDLTYGKVAQGAVGPFQKLNRIATMGRYLVAQYRATLSVARDFDADLLHGHWAIPTGPAIVRAANALGVPSVITLHGGDVYVNETQGYDFPTRWYVRPVLRRTLRAATRLTAITDDCRLHALRAGADDRRMEIVLNGADLIRFNPDSSSDPDYGFGPRMVFACRQLFPRKGIRFLIEAVALLSERFPDIQLVIAGDGFERPTLERQAETLGIGDRTTFLGWVANADLPAYYRASAVSVLPSLEEGFGIPAAEAMGCEVPVVASDAGGLPEVVEHGKTGLIVRKGNSQELAGALDTLLADPQLSERYGRAGRLRAQQLFSWGRSAEAFERVYSQCLDSRSTASSLAEAG